jgi:hypothetical protein
MKMSVLRSLVLILAALVFCVRTGFLRKATVLPLSGEFSADVTYVGEGDVERGGKHVNDFDEIDSDIRVVLTPRMKLGVLRLGAEWERFSFGLPEGPRCPTRCSPSARLLVSICSFPTRLLSERKLSLACTIRTGSLFWDDFNMPFLIGGTYIYSPNLQLVLA